MSRSLLAVVLLQLCAGPASSAVIKYPNGPAGRPYFDELMGPFLGNAFPTTPMQAGLKEMKFVPAYMTADKAQEESNGAAGSFKPSYDVHGLGAGVSYLQAWSDHWGASLTLAYQKGEGDISSQFVSGASNVTVQGATVEQNSYAGMAAVVYDYFSGEGFRMPVFVGVAVYGASDTRDFTGTVSGDTVRSNIETERSAVSPAIGIAPQFNTGPLRWTVFGAFLGSLGDPEVRAAGTNVTQGTPIGATGAGAESGSNSVATLGIEMMYRPWGLGTVWIPPIVLENGSFTFLSMKLTKRFG